MTAKAAVVGWPIQHSLSPVLHGHWLKEYGIDGAYEKIAIEPGRFETAIRDLQDRGYRGVNVTVPFKEDAFALATEARQAAQMARAANLLIFKPDGTIGADNTDATGLFDSLQATLEPLFADGKKIVVLGAGGAARAAVLGLQIFGHAASICVVNRTKARADSLIAQMGGLHPPTILQATSFDEWRDAAQDAALVINTTSAGMKDNPPLDLDLAALPASAAVCDIVYNPLMTPLLKDAQARGHKIVDGLGMLMHQAAPSFQAFFYDEMGGKAPLVTRGLRDALIRALGHG